MEYRRLIKKLNLEHGLILFDPDNAHNVLVMDSQDFQQLCRDSKDLWIEDARTWSQVVDKFNRQVMSLKSSWINKPKGDRSTLTDCKQQPHFQQDMVGLLQRLIDEEKAGLSSESAFPFLSSQQDRRSLFEQNVNFYESHQPLSQPATVHPLLQSSSTDPALVPPVSSQEAMEVINGDSDTPDFESLHNSSPDVNNDEMIVDQRDSVVYARSSDLWHDGYLQKDVIDYTRSSNGNGFRKRPASTIEIQVELRKPRFDGQYPVARSHHGLNADLGFTIRTPDFEKPDPGRYSSRSSSTSTSMSVTTQPNESFLTLDTAPSFGIHRSFNSFHSKLEQGSLDPRYIAVANNLIEFPPFVESNDAYWPSVSYRVAYEVCRVALHNEYDGLDMLSYITSQKGLVNNQQDIQDLDRLWSALEDYTVRHGGDMPVRTSDRVWRTLALSRNDLQHSKASFTGTLTFNGSSKGRLFDFKLNPTTIEQSNRMKRKFGSDRLLVLGFPSLEAGELPTHLKSRAVETRQVVIDWLTKAEHTILGRQWRAFYSKPKPKPRNKKGDKMLSPWRVYMFATKGPGFDERATDGEGHKPITLASMLKWFFSFEDNRGQELLKLFSRLQLSVSDTVPTLMFKLPGDSQTIVDDLALDGSKIGQVFYVQDIRCNDKIMTDGCGRISLRAAEEICKKLCLPLPPPSAFQGRIAGAKGMWIVEPDPAVHKECDLWIEIVNSQNKFESMRRDRSAWDDHRVMFEVNDFSRRLIPGTLNFQLLPILIDRGVKAGIFKSLLKADLETKVRDLEHAMSSPQALRAWNQAQFPVADQRLCSDGVTWAGGMPESDSEKINALTEAGFTPLSCPYLRELCEKAITHYCTRISDKFHIYPGKTTFAFMVPDFWGVLEEDEIHLGFSSAFNDDTSGWSDTMLHNCEVLVARLPAVLPSDIRRVRAVFKLELAFLKDIVVFPTKGGFCLADLLSGGDYDGDIAWICWNEEIVRDFVNPKVPQKTPFEHYGIEKDDTRVEDLLQAFKDEDCRATEFVRIGLEFNLRKSHLGKCTIIWEAFCYKLVRDAICNGATGTFFSPIHDPRTMDFARLLGFLVDAPKNGYTLTEANLKKYLGSIDALNLHDPAYKVKDGTPATEHIIDQLVLVIAANFKEHAMKKFKDWQKANSNSSDDLADPDLTRIFKNEEIVAREDPVLMIILRELKKNIEATWNHFHILNRDCFDRKVLSWTDTCRLIRKDFLEIVPGDPQDLLNHSLARRWSQDSVNQSPQSFKSSQLSTDGSWKLLKASAFYNRFHRGCLPWIACGRELLILKVLANQNGVSVSSSMHRYLKFDRRMWNSAVSKQSEMEEFQASDIFNRFDQDDFMNQMPEEAYEARANAE